MFRNRSRPCLEYQIKRCLGPCVLPVDRGVYEAHLREAMLLRHFGRAYPASEAEIQRFFGETPKAELSKLFAEKVTKYGDKAQVLLLPTPVSRATRTSPSPT